MENKQITMTINGVEYICTPKESEPKQSEQPQEPQPWRYNRDVNVKGFIISKEAEIESCALPFNVKNAYHIFATEKQAKSALAMARISQIMANDPRFGGAITDEEWRDEKEKYVILRLGNEVKTDWFTNVYRFLAFHTKKQRDLFLQENEDLVKDYLML